MANRYRVESGGNWDSAVNGWSTTSGGVAGAADPVAADDVFFDGNSGTGTVSIAANAFCRSFTGTGYTGTLGGASALIVGDATAGNIVIGSGMTWSHSGNLSLRSTTGTNTINTNGVSTACRIVFEVANTGTWQLISALTNTHSSGIGLSSSSTLDTNGNTVTAVSLTTDDFTPTITLGASTLNFSGTGTVWYAAGATLNANTSTINLTASSGTGSSVNLGGKTYNNMTVSAGGTGIISFSAGNNSNTFNTLTLAGPKNVRFRASQTQTFTSFVADGTAGNLVTIDSSLAGTAATFSDAAGTNALTYCSLQDFAATGGATWTAASSTNVSGNSGITFLVVGGGSTTTSTAMLVGVG